MKKRVTSRPLKQDRAAARRAAKREALRHNPREARVLEAPDGYVLRRLVPMSERWQYEQGAISPDGWWESSLTTLEVAREAARTLDPSYMIYAVRQIEGERHVALVPRDELLAGR